MIFLYILGVIFVVLIVLMAFAPKHYTVSRSITIARPRAEVYAYLKSVKNQDNWSPWKKKDPEMKQSFEGEDATVGFISRWEGNKDVGTGEQEIVKLVENERLETHLRFFKPWKSESNAFISCADDGQGTKVTWGFSGTHKVPANVFMMFLNMDKMVGKDFDEGLNNLKEILES